jgi:general secretion pathway protein M
MRLTPLTLPDGRHGQALAVALTISATAILWLCTAAPLIGWYDARAERLAQQEQLAQWMQALSQEIPALRRAISVAGLQSDSDQILLQGGTDVIAGANLQSLLQGLATTAGTTLDSAALLPAQDTGALRRVSMQVSVTTTWPVLIALLEAIGTTHPYLIVGQISLSGALQSEPSTEPALAANFTVTGFRAVAP